MRINSAKMLVDSECGHCKWPVIHCCCNDEMSIGEFGRWDWWVYCSNKGCKNHQGEGLFQDWPEWVVKSNDF